MEYPAHHLCTYLTQDQTVRYSQSSKYIHRANTTNIFELINQSSNFRIYLDMWNNFETRKVFRTKECKILTGLYSILEKKQKVNDKLLRVFASILMHAGASGPMRQMQKYFDQFSAFVPPMYREVIPAMNFDVEKREELIFHNCRPDTYLWSHPQTEYPKKVILVYLTKSNSLNMPLPFAHMVLSKYKLNILYIFNRPKKKDDLYVGEFKIKQSVKVIEELLRQFDFNEVFGIGASLGGYKLCQLAAALNITRILNFSGNIFHDKSTRKNMAPNYNHRNILSILSSTNDLDIKIARAYKEHGFKCLIDYIDYETHGSFTASFLEHKLDHYLDWLIHGKTSTNKEFALIS